jgi:RHS repeat-associated protein
MSLTVRAYEVKEIREGGATGVTCSIEPPVPVDRNVFFRFRDPYKSTEILPMIEARLMDLNADGFADIILSFEIGAGSVSAAAPCSVAPHSWEGAPPVRHVWINQAKSSPEAPDDPDFGWRESEEWAASLPPFYSIYLWSDAGTIDTRPGWVFPPGDNRKDLVGKRSTQGTAAYYFDHGVRMPDLNGDGRPDIVAKRGPAAFGLEAPVVSFPEGVWLSKSNGVGWVHHPGSTSPYLPPDPLVVEFGYRADNPKFVLDADTGVRFADLNGDGLADIIKTDAEPVQSPYAQYDHQPLPPALLQKGIWLNTGNGWCGPGDPRCDTSAQDYLPTSANAGRFAELYTACSGLTANGTPVSQPCKNHTGVRGTELRFVDLNGDGLIDLLKTDDPDFGGMAAWIHDPSDPAIWRWDGRFVPDEAMATIRKLKGTAASSGYQIWDSGVRIFDFDGDATIDLLRDVATVAREMLVSKSAHIDLIEKVSNGQGGSQSFSYRSAIEQRDSELEETARSDAEDPIFGEAGEIGTPRWTARAIVSEWLTQDATPGGSTHSTLLKYAMPRWDPEKRSQLGFRVVQSSTDDESIARTFFWQKFGRAGRASRILNLNARGLLMRQKIAIWEVIPGSESEGSFEGTHIGRVVEEETANFFGGAANRVAGATQSILYRYADETGHSYGHNFVHEVETSRPSGMLRVERIPAPKWIDPDRRLIGRLAKEVQRDGHGNVLKETRFDYAGALPILERRTITVRHEEWESGFADIVSTYDEYGNLRSRTDPESRTTYLCYDGDTAFSDGSACSDAMGTDSHTVVVGLKDPSGGITRFRRDLASGTATELARLYSGDLESIELDRFGRPERLWIQPAGHATGKIRAERNYIDGIVNAGRPYVEQWDYFEETAETDASAAVRSAIYLDGFGRETVGVSSAAPGHAYPFGRAVTERDYAGRPLRVTFDIACSSPDCMELATYDGSATTVQSHDALGRVLTRSTPDGVTAFGYRRASLNPPVGPGSGADVSLDAILMKDPMGNLTEHLFDGDRLVKVNECKNGISPDLINLSDVSCLNPDSTFYTYEATGELDTIYDAHPAQDYESPARQIRYHHDTLGRVWKVSDPDRGVSYMDHDRVGNVVRTLDARGRVVVYQYDELDRLRLVDTPGDAGNWDLLEIAYDPVTRKRSRVTAEGMTYSESWEYDDFGNLETNIRRVIGRTLRTDLEFDLMGRLVTLKSPLADRESTRYVYDGAYLSKVCSGPNGSSCESAQQISFIDGVVYDALGRVAAISGPQGDLSYDYYDTDDPEPGRFVTQLKSMALDGARLNLAYAYDANGNVSQIADQHAGDNLNASADYRYDRRNRLASWRDANQTERHFAYDSIGNLVGRNLPAAPGSASDWNQVYDASNKPHAVRMNWNDKGYDYDASGNVVRRGGEHFTYNALGQLYCVGDAQGSCNGGFFWYDIDGNLLSKTVGSTSEIYLGSYFRFDTGSSTAWTYTGALGRRIAVVKKSGALLRSAWAPPTWPFPIDRGPFLGLLTAAGLLVALVLLARIGVFETLASRPVAASIALGMVALIAAPPQVWAARRGRTPSSVIRYLFHDRLGTEILATNHRGDVEERRIFEPFGEVIDSWIDPASNTAAVFTGKRYHDQLGMYHFGARWYDAEAGRFSSIDPVVQSLTDPQTHNPYGYVRNNPIGNVDPDGREMVTAIVALTVLAKVVYYAAIAYTAYSSTRSAVEALSGGASGATPSQRQDSVVAENTLTIRGEPAGKGARSTARNYAGKPEDPRVRGVSIGHLLTAGAFVGDMGVDLAGGLGMSGTHEVAAGGEIASSSLSGAGFATTALNIPAAVSLGRTRGFELGADHSILVMRVPMARAADYSVVSLSFGFSLKMFFENHGRPLDPRHIRTSDLVGVSLGVGPGVAASIVDSVGRGGDVEVLRWSE